MAAENLGRNPADVIAGGVVAAVGVAYTIVALQTPAANSSASVIGPAIVPTLLGVLLALGGAAVAIGGLRLRPAEGKADPAGTTEPAQSGGLRLWVTIAIFGAYVLAFIPVGYLLSTIAFLMGLATYFSPTKWKSNLIFAISFPLIVFVMFEYLLRVPLPQGLLSGVL
ncbi:tripartite tricarboxylate transporter TctB family protein [Arthrobacter sp. NPDC089319]|uniref:tripartite tricarboxylate transporter TctB family protein n=1 Tax=Arthrobacter sp. NPDC089319 TaxID=3155915 RepID=UPI00343F0FBB